MQKKTAYHIMFIDDEVNILKLYSAILRDNGFTVSEFSSAADAIRFLGETEEDIDLIIADVNMPEMTGIQFLDHIKNKPKFTSIPVIFLSAISDSAIQVDAFNLGAVDYLTKPVRKELFLSKIRALLQSYSLKKIDSSIFLEGTKQEKELAVIVSLCEEQKLNGFAVLCREEQLGVLHFNGGMLEKIELENLKDADAFDKLSSWDDYCFVIFHGTYNKDIIHSYLQDKVAASSSAQETKSGMDAADSNRGPIEGAVESLTFKTDLAESLTKAANLQYTVLYDLYADFTQSAADTLKQKPKQVSLEFTDNKVLLVRYGTSANQLIMFNNKKSANAFLEEK